MKLSRLLHKIAARSPAHYAKTILKRNVSLRKRLMLLEPYIGCDNIPPRIYGRAFRETSIGCPHCRGIVCENCLWTKICKRRPYDYTVCVSVQFDGISLADVWQGHRTLQLRYHESCECLAFVYYADHHILRDEWERILRFIDAHIAWAQLPEWGTK